MDCLSEEMIRMEDFRMRYLENDNTPKEGFKFILDVKPENNKQYSSSSDTSLYFNEVRVRHYFNKLSGDYVILVNRQYPIYVGKMTTKH
jgi:hypothetical protein